MRRDEFAELGLAGGFRRFAPAGLAAVFLAVPSAAPSGCAPPGLVAVLVSPPPPSVAAPAPDPPPARCERQSDRDRRHHRPGAVQSAAMPNRRGIAASACRRPPRRLRPGGGARPRRAARPGGGRVLVVGDSLEELTSPYLQHLLPGVPITVNAVGGSNSFQIFDLFQESYEPSDSVIVFDAGTNDDPEYPQILAENLKKVAAHGRRSAAWSCRRSTASP